MSVEENSTQPIDGVVDFHSGNRVLGWIDPPPGTSIQVVVLLDQTSVVAEFSPFAGRQGRMRFKATLPRACSASELISGNIRVEARAGATTSLLRCWEPIRLAASIEAMSPVMMGRLFSSLSPQGQELIRDAVGAVSDRTAIPASALKPANRPKRALFGNAAFQTVAGSELVILELIEHLTALGWSCDVTAWLIGDPMRSLAGKAGATILPVPAQVRPFEYDLVWLQNRLEPILDYTSSDNEADRTLFAFAHLDRSWSLAQPGVVAEGLLGQLFVVPSEVAAVHVVERGLPRAHVHMFRNAAPKSFEMSAGEPLTVPRRLLMVSNHPPKEAIVAAELLRDRGVDVTILGGTSDSSRRRLTPEDMAHTDGLITIGKTVPYALRARRPVYIYDHFGGPGWLNGSNFDDAAAYNFNGSCCGRRISANQMVEEILKGFAEAAAESARGFERQLDSYRLETFVAALLERLPEGRPPREHRARLALRKLELNAEMELAKAAGHYFAVAMRQVERREPT